MITFIYIYDIIAFMFFVSLSMINCDYDEEDKIPIYTRIFLSSIWIIVLFYEIHLIAEDCNKIN